MSNLVAKSQWVPVPYFEPNALLTGGPDCPDNVPIQALADRTEYLKATKLNNTGGEVDGPVSIVNATPTRAAYSIKGDIGGMFVDWTKERMPALQVDAPSDNLAYMIWRATKWGGRHLAAMEAYAGGNSTSTAGVYLHIDGGANQFGFFGDGVFDAEKAIRTGQFRAKMTPDGNYSIGGYTFQGENGLDSGMYSGGDGDVRILRNGIPMIGIDALGVNIPQGTTVTQNESSNNGNLASTAFVQAAIKAATKVALGPTGFAKLPNGLMLQWGLFKPGKYTASEGPSIWGLTFPVAFSAAYGCWPVGEIGAGLSGLSVEGLTGTGCILRYTNQQSVDSIGIYWFAIGKE